MPFTRTLLARLATRPQPFFVDFEHTRRMLRMLDLAGRTPVGLTFEDEGHGVGETDNQEQLWNGVAGFLRQHLGGAAAGTSKSGAAAAP